MPEDTPQTGDAGTTPASDGVGQATSPVPSDAQPRTFTQEDVDRIVTERLRRERQRLEKAAQETYEQRIAELEAAQEAGLQAQGDAETLAGALQAAEKRALIAERLLVGGGRLPPAYLAQIDGESVEEIDAAIATAHEQWAEDLRRFGSPGVSVGAPSSPAGPLRQARPAVDAALAERLRQGDAEAYREYRAIRR